MSAKRPPDEGRLLQLVYYAYVAFSRFALALPEPVAYGLARFAGGLAAKRSRKRAIVEKNLARVTGLRPGSSELDELVTEAFRSYGRYWLETFRLVREGREFFLERFRGLGAEHLDEALALGRGGIVVVGHLGNWDAAGAWVGARGNRLVTVAEVLRPRRMFDFFVRHRERLGMHIIPAAPGATDRIAESAEAGAIVAILGDRDLKGKGPVVTFFGEETTFPAGAASVALRTGVPLMVAGVYEERLPDGRRGWRAEISPFLDVPEGSGPEAVRELTQRIATAYEGFVRKHPEQWHVFQPFWLADRTGQPGQPAEGSAGPNEGPPSSPGRRAQG